MNKLILLLLLSSLSFSSSAEVTKVADAADSGVADDKKKKLGQCKSAGVLDSSLINDVPWNAMYPIKLAGFNISPTGSGSPSNSSKKVFCACEDDLGIAVPGFTQAMYEPARIIELVREPDCMMTLNGTKLGLTNGRMRGSIGDSKNDEYRGNESAFWHYHYFAYPLLLMLEMVNPNRCGDGYLSMDLMYLSEVDPTWNDPELGFFANPESAIFNNPISLASCIADAAAAAVGKPFDNLFWCSGAWGSMYPFSGKITGKSDIPTKTSLLATRAVAALHRRLLARKTAGDDALCSSPIFPTIPKSQYKMNMMYPVPETNDAHEIGEPSLLWGMWRNIPSKEDNVYMLWRWNDCCFTYY